MKNLPATRLMACLTLLVLLAARPPDAAAYWTSAARQPVPPHAQAWIEQTEPDPRTALLWKFSTEDDRGASLDALLDSDDLFALPEAGPALGPAPGAATAEAPNLEGDARLVAGAGRFGGGLAVAGNGFARGTAPLTGILGADGAFTLDFWFQASRIPDAPALLARLAAVNRQPLLELVLTPERQVALVTQGASRMELPVNATPEGWHHVTLVVQQAGVLTLMVDDRVARIPESHTWERGEHAISRELRLQNPNRTPEWLTGLTRRLGSEVIIGGAPDTTGLHGVIDEVRVSRGERLFYRWHLGHQERPDDPAPPDPAPPWFRGASVAARLRFDGTLAPTPADAARFSGQPDAARYQSGLRGQSVDLSRIDETRAAWDGIAWPPDRDGTIEFWFRPLDWNNFYRGEYHGTDLPSPRTLMALRNEAGVIRPIQVHRGTAGANGNLSWFRIHPGTWTHVLLVFENGGQTKYINGQRTRFDQVWLFPRGGDGPWRLQFQQSPTLLDELSLYPWAMNSGEAWNAYARWLPDADEQMRPLPSFEVRFTYVAHSWNMQEHLRTRIACLAVDGRQPTHLDFELQAEDGSVLFAVEQQALDDAGTANLRIDQGLPFGRYPATLTSRMADGTPVAELAIEYHRERPDWYENTLGLDRSVPPPWEAMAVSDQTVSLSGRVITLGADGLPARIRTLERDVLTGPVELQATLPDGATVTLTGAGTTIEVSDPDRVSWRASATGGGLTADLSAWMEFDGLLYTTVTLQPTGGNSPITVDALRIEFPMAPSHTTQLIANGGGSNFRRSWLARYIPDGEGRVWSSADQPYPAFTRAIGLSNYMPHIWVGDDVSGLYFGGENDRGWTVGGDHPAQEIVRDEHTVRFRLNVIREPLSLGPDGHDFHFVILPTPAKPEPPNWRYDVTRGGYSFGSMDSFGGNCMKTDPANPEAGDSFRLEPRSWEHAATASATQRERWGQCILYADASWPRPGPSFADWNHDLFAGTGRIAWTPEFEDYVTWVVNEYLERELIDGIYFDDVSVGHTFSLAATAYPFPAAEQGRRIGFTHLAQRRVLMRLWRLFLAHGKDPGISVHMTYAYEVPIFSFCQYIYNAEIFSGVGYPRDRDAMDEWPADRMRILAGAAKWGAGHPFISTLPRGFGGMDANWVYRQTRTEDAAFIAADVPGAAAPWGALAAVFTREGVFDEGVRGYPFWASAGVVDVTAPQDAHINTAVFVHDDRAYVFTANRDREERAVTIRLPDGAIFPAGSRLAWRDLDPGLKPPASSVAGADELRELAAGPSLGLLDEAPPALDDDALQDLIEGTTPAERALERLHLQVDDEAASVVIRPRDYRLLEVRPR